MQLENVGNQLASIIGNSVSPQTTEWLEKKIETICENKSTKDLYLSYSLVASKISKEAQPNFLLDGSELHDYLKNQNATSLQLARIYLLIKILSFDKVFFGTKVARIIEVADTSELETFLKFLILLPNPEDYKNTAVEALRTNISTVFNAIAHHNPYPSRFFDDQQWNQMYLKTAFMQGDLSAILNIDERANKDLARIISDYAHERWAAGRDIDPYFWRPVTKFIDAELLKDIERLLQSDTIAENRAGALCCYYSGTKEAGEMLEHYPKLKQQLDNATLSWKTIKEE